MEMKCNLIHNPTRCVVDKCNESAYGASDQVAGRQV